MDKLDKDITERIESVGNDENGPEELYKKAHAMQGNFTGTVQLADGEVTYLIPTPSADPRGMIQDPVTRSSTIDHSQDPLNLPKWRKWVSFTTWMRR